MTEIVDTIAGEIAAREWHEVNKEDATTKEAIEHLDKALLHVGRLYRDLEDAARLVENTGVGDRLASLTFDVDAVETTIKQLRGRLT